MPRFIWLLENAGVPERRDVGEKGSIWLGIQPVGAGGGVWEGRGRDGFTVRNLGHQELGGPGYAVLARIRSDAGLHGMKPHGESGDGTSGGWDGELKLTG